MTVKELIDTLLQRNLKAVVYLGHTDGEARHLDTVSTTEVWGKISGKPYTAVVLDYARRKNPVDAGG